jgi:hypothetical protein
MIIKIPTIAVMSLAACVMCDAQGALAPRAIPQLAFSTCSTNPQTTLSYAVVSANSANGGVPVVRFISAGSDKATSRVQFYRVDAFTSANYTNSTTRLDVDSTNNIADGGTIVIRHTIDDTYEKRTLTTSTGSTNLVVTVAPLEAVIPGDIIYHVTQSGAGCIRLGVATNNISGDSVYVGQAGYPLLLEVDATTSGELNVVSGTYRTTPP